VGEYFYHGIFRKTTVAFGNLFNNIQIQKVNDADNTINVMKVGLGYGPTQKFLARLNQMGELDQPTQITLPRMSFEMTGISYDATRKTKPTQTFKTTDRGEKIQQVYLPVPYNVDFELSIMAKLNEDCLQIVEQILPYFQPAYTTTVDLLEEVGEKRDIPIVLNSIEFTDDYEGDFASRRILLYTLRFTAKTYIFGPLDDSGNGLIRKVQVDYHTTHKRPPVREVRYTVTPDPIDAGPDDDFGFNEETELFFDSKVYSPTQNIDYTPDK
jgi:hypothetical protein